MFESVPVNKIRGWLRWGAIRVPELEQIQVLEHQYASFDAYKLGSSKIYIYRYPWLKQVDRILPGEIEISANINPIALNCPHQVK
jgi:hypothetical protein